jgi:hypothetical protein
MPNHELQENTANQEASPATAEEQEWMKRAIASLPEHRREQFASLPQDVSVDSGEFGFSPDNGHVRVRGRGRAPPNRVRDDLGVCVHQISLTRARSLIQVLCVVRGFQNESDREKATFQVCSCKYADTNVSGLAFIHSAARANARARARTCVA